MKRHVLSLLLLALASLSTPTPAADLKVEESKFDVQGRFTVQVPVPAGTRHAALEILNPGPPAAWRTLISGSLDGRKARVIFQVPENYRTSALVRAKAGPETTVPTPELTDPSLFTVVYESPIGEQTKINFLKDAAAKMGGWGSLPKGEAQARLIAWALTNPLVAEASVTTLGDNISIRFTDDDIVVVMSKPRRYDLTEMPPLARVEPPEQGSKDGMFGPKATTGLSIPGSRQCISAFSLESTFPNSAPTIASWLDSHGYKTDRFPSTPVLTVKSWSTAATPIGVLFWQIHGCPYKRKNGTESTALVTREFASEALSQGAYATMRGTGQLGLAIADGETVPYYTITGSFIRAFMRFAPNSLVVVDACFGANPDLAKAFIDAGAGSYVSWDWLSGPESGTPCKQLFDRLLGMNTEAPVSAIPERPFTVDVVSQWMHRKGYDEDPSTKFPNQPRPNSVLMWTHRQSNPAHMLRPSLMRILEEANSPGEPFTKFLLEGDFGDDPGTGNRKVLWAAKEMNVLRWDALEGIVIRIPSLPPVGNLQVLVKKEHEGKSNEVPITEWNVPFTFDRREQGSLNANITFNVKFRADIHGERYEPEGQVFYLPKVMNVMEDCRGILKASGTYKPDKDSTYTWHGGGNLVSVDLGTGQPPPSDLIMSSGVFTGSGTTMFFSLNATGNYKETYTSSGGSETTDQLADLDGSDFFITPPKMLPPAYLFVGDTKTHSSGTQNDTLKWTTATPQMVPTNSTPR